MRSRILFRVAYAAFVARHAGYGFELRERFAALNTQAMMKSAARRCYWSKCQSVEAARIISSRYRAINKGIECDTEKTF